MIKYELSGSPACPNCGTVISMAGNLVNTHSVPKPKDVLICPNCIEALEFSPGMKLKRADLQTLQEAGLLNVSQAQEFARIKKRL